MKKTMVIFLVLLQINQISCNSKNKNCELKEIKTLFVIPGVYEGQITGYSHYILIKNFSKKCIDSATIVNYALSYIDSVKDGRPAGIIKFFTSDKNFIPNETSQVMEEINKDCLVTIGFDLETQKPNDFIFYDDRGNISYWGNRWVPFPKGKDIYITERAKK